MDTLYYDGSCPICVREIGLLRRLARESLHLQDLNTVVDHPGEPTRLLMRTTLHLKTADSHWLTGLDANVRAWSHTDWGWMWQPLRWPGIRALADRAYAAWAKRRYQRLYGCLECAEES